MSEVDPAMPGRQRTFVDITPKPLTRDTYISEEQKSAFERLEGAVDRFKQAIKDAEGGNHTNAEKAVAHTYTSVMSALAAAAGVVTNEDLMKEQIQKIESGVEEVEDKALVGRKISAGVDEGAPISLKTVVTAYKDTWDHPMIRHLRSEIPQARD